MTSLPDEHILGPLMPVRVMLPWQREQIFGCACPEPDAQPAVLGLSQTITS